MNPLTFCGVALLSGYRTAEVPKCPVFGRFVVRSPDSQARFISPAGQVTDIDGFSQHGNGDGDGENEFRFAPREPGRWRYVVGGNERSFDAVRGPDSGFVHRDGSRLVDGAGAPFYPLGENRMNVFDPEWNYRHKSI